VHDHAARLHSYELLAAIAPSLTRHSGRTMAA